MSTSVQDRGGKTRAKSPVKTRIADSMSEQLCASSASCGAAALGFAFGQYRPASAPRSDGPPAPPSAFETSIASRPLSSAHTPRKRWQLDGAGLGPRPQTVAGASNLDRPNRKSAGARLEEGGEVQGSAEGSAPGDDLGELDTVGEAGNTISRRRSWLHRLSNITISQESSTGSLPLPRPGTPSILSANGSTAPFFARPTTPTSTAVNTRNRLVKRSASQRALQSASPASSAFPSTASAAPLRRPVTSHQRLEHIRLQNLQDELAASPVSLPDSGSREGKQGHTITCENPEASAEAKDKQLGTWKPFFHYRVVKAGRDLSFRTTSEPANRPLTSSGGVGGPSDPAIRCIVEPPSTASAPTLVLAPAVQKPSPPARPHTSSPYTRRLSSHLPRSFSFGPDASALRAPPEPSGGPPSALDRPGTRSSFSIADLFSYPSPTVRRAKKRGRVEQRLSQPDPLTLNQRSASAPLPTVMAGPGTEAEAAEQVTPKPHKSPRTLRPEEYSPTMQDTTPDQHATGNARRGGQDTGNGIQPGSGTSSGNGVLSRKEAASSRNTSPSNDRTTSRVSSGQDSAGFGSDISRVFSEGEDGDGRSDTVFDSIRTEATNNSHSGAKAQHVENLFNGSLPAPDWARSLSGMNRDRSAPSSYRQSLNDQHIAEEDDGSATPGLSETHSHGTNNTALPHQYHPSSVAGTAGSVDEGGDDRESATPAQTRKRKTPLPKVANPEENFPSGSNIDPAIPDATDSLSLSPPFRGRLRLSSPTSSNVAMAGSSEPADITASQSSDARHVSSPETHLNHQSYLQPQNPSHYSSQATDDDFDEPTSENYRGRTFPRLSDDDRFLLWHEGPWEYVAIDKGLLGPGNPHCFVTAGPDVGDEAFKAVLRYVATGVQLPALLAVPMRREHPWPQALPSGLYDARVPEPRKVVDLQVGYAAAAPKFALSVPGGSRDLDVRPSDVRFFAQLPSDGSPPANDTWDFDDSPPYDDTNETYTSTSDIETEFARREHTVRSILDPERAATAWANLSAQKAICLSDLAKRQEMQRTLRMAREQKRQARADGPNGTDDAAHGKANIFDWSEPRPTPPADATGDHSNGTRPKTAHVQAAGTDRGGRSNSRRGAAGAHLRSQSVPLAPEGPNRLSGAAAKLDAWVLGGKGVSEDWDNDFEFEDDGAPPSTDAPRPSTVTRGTQPVTPPAAPSASASFSTPHRAWYPPVVVPHAILEKQASVHGQFGQVKELTLLVEELRRLRHAAATLDILCGPAHELWKEAEGIIDLATLDEDEPLRPGQQSPTAASVDFDAFDDDGGASPGPLQRRRSSSSTVRRDDGSPLPGIAAAAAATSSTPTRPRQESIAKAKHVLESIAKHRSGSDPATRGPRAASPAPDAAAPASPGKKLPFDTTSLRDLVTRAGVVTRALKDVVRRAEDPDYVPSTPERSSGGGSGAGGGGPARDPAFSQIFQRRGPDEE